MRKYPVDTRAVLTECQFINWAHDNPEKVDEPLWYAALSIVGRLERGVELAHKLSQGHPKYTHAETEEKLGQALDSSGPRTCADINARWGKCQSCPHFQKVKSPILIRGEEFIATESQGFYSIVETKQGEKFVPNYDDLLKFFIKQTNYKVISQTGIVYVYKENRYEVLPPLEILGFAEEHFDPKPKSAYREEFKTKVLSNRQVDVSFFDAPGKLNFKNGVLNTITDEFLPHSPDLGFRYVLPYDYDPTASAPQFEQFLKDVTLDDPELQLLLKQFGGYALSGDDCWAQKALILTGEGRNGKSVFLQVLGAVAGKNNTGYLNLAQLKNDNNRQLLEGRLFNLSEETPDYAMQESSLFKQLVTGGEITVKQMYHQPYIIKNRCKLLFACNDIPVSKDKSAGLTRRLLIIPFKKEFQDSNVDYKIFDKLATELPGIFNAFRNAYKPLASEQVGFKPPESMREVMEEFKKDNDIVYDYAHCGRIKFHKIGASTHRVLMSKIYEDFTMFYEVDQHQRTGLPTFRAFCKRFKRAVPGFDARVRYDMSKEYRNKLVMFDAELEQLE
jgi:P4 family phage/plasmid primase-like protien